MDERMEVADILLRYEKLDMALEVLEELREEFPNEKDVYYKLAKVYEKKGFFDKSLEMLNNVRIMYPKDGQVYFKIAVIYQMKDQLDKCFEFLSLAIKNGFASEEVMYYKGLAYEAEDDLNKAIYNYNKSLSSNKNYLPSKYRKYAIFMRMNRVDDAKAVIEDMIKYNADEYDGYG
ncbi:tetratricopeptide repeat protein, partial [Clostridium sp.]